MFCLTNIWFVRCYSLGSLLFVRFVIFSIMFLYACFPSQTSRTWCSAIPSAPFSRTLYYILCSTVMFFFFSEVALPRKCRSCAILFLWLGVIVTRFFRGLYYSVICSPCFVVSLYTYVLVTCTITLGHVLLHRLLWLPSFGWV